MSKKKTINSTETTVENTVEQNTIDETKKPENSSKSKIYFWIIFVFVIVLLWVGWYFGYRFYQIQNIKTANQHFFSYLKDNKNFEARNETAMVFKQRVNLSAFDRFIKDNNLQTLNFDDLKDWELKSFKWKLSWRFWDSTIQVLFVDEAGQRKLYEILLWNWIKLPADFTYVPPKVESGTGSGRTSVRPKELDEREEKNRLPNVEESQKLIADTMSWFVDAISQKDFKNFYANSAELFKWQTDAKTIQAGFQKFIDEKIDLNYIKTLTPELSWSIIKDNYWFLVLNWKYSKWEKQDLNFTLKYNKEDSLWKLVSISVTMN